MLYNITNNYNIIVIFFKINLIKYLMHFRSSYNCAHDIQ